MDKLLKLYAYVDGGANDTPFPDADNQIEIGEFRYDAKRMGGAPTITANVYYPSCLDEVWTENVYAEFNGEKYYLKQVPTSSYSNEDSRYKHDLELVSERVALDNVYFYDTVSDEAVGDDKPVSNSTKFVFHGDIHEFASRLGHSLAQSGLDYTVHVDTGVSSESLLISFENAFFSNAIQEAYNTYNIPYYFVGKEIHFGLAGNNIEEVLSYGVDDALLSITKSNANYKIVNRATGTGSSDNIPFYYPNNSPKGEIAAEHSREGASVSIVNAERYANKVALDGVIKYEDFSITEESMTSEYGSYISGEEIFLNKITGSTTRDFNLTFFASNVGKLILNLNYAIDKVRNPIKGSFLSSDVISCRFTVTLYKVRGDSFVVAKSVESGSVEIPITSTGSYVARITMEFASKIPDNTLTCYYKLHYSFDEGFTGWTYEGKEINLSDIGLSVSDAVAGDTITQRPVRYINTSDKLLPSVYRKTNGAERFYNAIKYPYPKPEGFDDTLLNGYYGEDGILRNPLGEYEVEGYIHNDAYKNEDGTYINFNNPYVKGRPKEHIITVEDIKPTIKETVVNGLRIDMFSEFAYDEDDNDELIENEEGSEREYVHSYFFAKLRKLDFNLFDHAIEQQPMTISFTDGDCGACNFEIGVTEEFPQKNPVQVNADGTLKRDANGRVICGQFEDITEDECQPQQQDTINHEVWIALKKEETTYGILMPQSLHRPKACSKGQNDGDAFVILGINLPFSYIQNAEEKLEKEIIKYIKENNEEKFKFSITFSRIYFEENPRVLELLNENSSLKVSYNGRTYDLYVSSFSYTMSEGDVLPEIRVELDDTLQVTQNALQNAISEVKSQIGSVVRTVNSQMAMQRASYIQRQSDDEAYGNVNFTKGIKFGEGGKIEVLDNNSAKLTIEYLEVTKKATFTSLEIQEKTHVGGQMLITPAAINCGEVEEFDNYYRCYFQTKGEDGDEIFNQFAVGDQAICQTFNAWGSKYYWRLVVGIGEDYIDLSKTDCDEGSGIPSAGDKIIQMGNRNDEARQNAIVIAAYGDGSPYIIQYKGINNFNLPTTNGEDDRIMTMLSPTKNILTGQVKMVAGSSGLELFDEWAEKQKLIDSKASSEDFDAFKELVGKDIEDIQKQVDGAITTWFYEAEPTLTNAPAVDWTTDEDKNNHLGDLYYSGAGKAYRFQYDEATSAYYWNLITDEDITQALALAQKAQDTADGKRRVFVNTPTPPYDEGDLWSQGPTLPMMICVNGRAEGSFQEDDWDFADNTSQLATQIAGYKYIKEAIQNGSTIVTGGLIQSGVLMLGHTNASGQYQVMSGTNGIYNSSLKGGGIAAWYGGLMVDREAPNAVIEGAATSLHRFDGSGYFAKGNISWDADGAIKFAGGKLSITKNGALVLGNDIAFGSDGDETIQTIISKLSTIMTWFEQYDDNTIYTPFNLVTGRQIAAAQAGTASGGGTGSLIFTGPWSDYTSEKADYALAASLGYDLHSRIMTLEGKATNVSFTQSIAVGKQIGTISIDGKATNLYAPSTYAWSEVTGKPTFATVATSGSYNDLSNKPTTISGYGITDAYTKTEVNNALSGYLPLSGGTINGVLKLNSNFYTNNVYFNREGVEQVLLPYAEHNYDLSYYDGSTWERVLTSKNYSSYALPLSGGTMTGTIQIGAYTTFGPTGGNFYLGSPEYPLLIRSNGTTTINGNALIHSGNIGSQSVNYANSAGHSDRLISPYSYEGGTCINNDTTPESLFGSTYTFSAMMENCSAFNGYATVLNFSGYLQYGGTQLAVSYNNTTPRMALRNFSQVSWKFTDWRELAFLDDNVASATNADMLDGYHASYGNNTPWGTIPVITISGWMDVGKHFEFHYDNSNGSDYSTILQCTGNYSNVVDLPSASGTLALITDNVASATKLQTARTIWGQSFDGTGNVSGDITLYNAIGAFFSDKWADSNGNTHPWYGLDFTHVSTGVTLSSYFGLTFKVGEGAMTINSYGNVGIGTASPDAKLDVVGGRIKCNYSIFGGRYNTNSNAAAFIWDKPGNYFTGVGSDGTTDTIRFSACNADGTWGSYSQNWKFYGNIIAVGAITASSTLTIGSATLTWNGSALVVDKPLVSAGFVAGATATATASDMRLKTVDSDISLDIRSIANAPLFNYHLNEHSSDLQMVGSSAQYWMSILPKSVVEDGTDNHFLSLFYDRVALASAITTARVVVSHEDRITELEEMVRAQEEEIKYLKSKLN